MGYFYGVCMLLFMVRIISAIKHYKQSMEVNDVDDTLNLCAFLVSLGLLLNSVIGV